MAMNLKPFRDIDEHEVLNYFSTVEGDVTKGTFVQIVSFDPDNHNGYGLSLPDVADGAFSSTYEVYAKVRKANGVTGGAATGVIGMTLVDVVSKNSYVVTAADSKRYYDKIPSGQAVPLLKRGLVELMGFSGVPNVGLRGYVTFDGQLAVGNALTTPHVGTFLSTSGADGAALFQVNCI